MKVLRLGDRRGSERIKIVSNVKMKQCLCGGDPVSVRIRLPEPVRKDFSLGGGETGRRAQVATKLKLFSQA